MENSRDVQTEENHLSFVWKGFEYTARCFQLPVVVIQGTAHLTDEPHSVRGDDAIADNLLLKRNQDGLNYLRERCTLEHFIPWGIDAGYNVCSMIFDRLVRE